MRIGQNPSKYGIPAYTPKSLGVALITFIPDNSIGYFVNALNILKVQIASLRKNTSEPFDLLVVDNGSCIEVQRELQKMQYEGKIDWLILSAHNLGKTGALNWILASMPNEWICYADSDVFFRKGWEIESRKLFELIPDVGVVTAQPAFYENLKNESLALKQIQAKGYKVTSAKPEEWIALEYAVGLGADESHTERILQTEVPLIHDLQGVPRAYSGASHMQFLARRDQVRQILPLPAKLALSTEEDRVFDTRIDENGWLRLTTMKPYVVHMGNRIEDSLLPEIKLLGDIDAAIDNQQKSIDHKQKFFWKMLVAMNHIGFIRKLFRRIYMNLFELYSFEKK